MNTTALRYVRRLFNTEHVPARTNRHNQRQWVRSVRFLGDKWLLATPVARRTP